MVNTRSKIKKTKKSFKTSFPQASMEDSDQQSTESGTSIGSNDDLLTEILLRLPVTSILRFKSVSKHWQWLLSHRHFTLRYDSVSKSPGLFAGDRYVPFDVENVNRSSPPFRGLDFYFNSRKISIVQSCNGLLLVCDDAWYSPALIYYVFNPTTKQVAVIPSILGGRKVQKTICFMGLAFHQTDCVHYKLVCIRRLVPDEDLFQIQVYSSDTSKWNISIESFTANHPTFQNGVYWNGAMHWCPSYESHLYFKMDTEQLLTLPLPVEMMSSETYPMYFGESRGHLHLIETKYNRNISLRVYEMLSDHSGWFVKYQLELDQLPRVYKKIIGWYGYDVHLIDLVRGEKEEDTFIVLTVPGNMIRYNVHDKSVKWLTLAGPSSSHRYIETLFCF